MVSYKSLSNLLEKIKDTKSMKAITSVGAIALLVGGVAAGIVLMYTLNHEAPYQSWDYVAKYINNGGTNNQENNYANGSKGINIVQNGNNDTVIIKVTNNYYNNSNKVTNNYYNNSNNYYYSNNNNASNIAPSSQLEQIINEYQTFGTNSSIVILQVKSVTQISNQSALLTVYNPNTRENQYIIVPINESYFELTNGSAISIDNALPKLPKGEYSYLLISINNPNNITESGINYIGEINGTPAVSLSENANIGYMITNASPDQLANYLTAAMNGQAKIIMLTSYGVWEDPNGLWGWDNTTKQSVIVNFPSSSAVNYAKQMIGLADSILGTNTPNPGQYGVIPMVIIENPNVSQQQGYTAYNLSPNDYIDIILLTPHQGQQLESKILNGQSLTPAVYLPLLAGITSGISKYTGNPFEGRKRVRDHDIFRDSTPLTY